MMINKRHLLQPPGYYLGQFSRCALLIKRTSTKDFICFKLSGGCLFECKPLIFKTQVERQYFL